MSAVDVVVPCHNYSRYLEQCIGTVLGQEGVDVRVLIIDDCSSDDTPAVGRGLAKADPRVQFRRHEENRGHIATYNEGLLEWASAEYSLLLSADDALAPGALARATNLMDRHPAVGMTYGMARIIVNDDPPPAADDGGSSDHRIIVGREFLRHCFEQTVNPVPTPSAVVRTKLQHELGGYRKDYPHAGDLEMWMRFAANSSVACLHAVQAYYRWHTTNLSQQYFGQPLSDLREVAEVCREVIQRHGGKFPESRKWPRTYLYALARKAVSSASGAFNEGRTAECQERLALATEIWPTVRYSRAYLLLGVKRLLGQSLWQWMRPMANRLRGIPPESRAPEFSRGLQVGWWPG